VDPAAVRAFATRDRESVQRAKRAYHADRHAASHAMAGFIAGQALREHVRRLRPDWPTPDDRAADLAHHVELKRLLDRAADAFARR